MNNRARELADLIYDHVAQCELSRRHESDPLNLDYARICEMCSAAIEPLQERLDRCEALLSSFDGHEGWCSFAPKLGTTTGETIIRNMPERLRIKMSDAYSGYYLQSDDGTDYVREGTLENKLKLLQKKYDEFSGMGGMQGTAPERIMLAADERFGCDAWLYVERVISVGGDSAKGSTPVEYVRKDVAQNEAYDYTSPMIQKIQDLEIRIDAAMAIGYAPQTKGEITDREIAYRGGWNDCRAAFRAALAEE